MDLEVADFQTKPHSPVFSASHTPSTSSTWSTSAVQGSTATIAAHVHGVHAAHVHGVHATHVHWVHAHAHTSENLHSLKLNCG